MQIRPRFKHLGDFGLSKTVRHAEIVIRMSLRRRIVVNVDDPRGVYSWKLVYKVLPGTLDGSVTLDGDEGVGPGGTQLSRADYVWLFYLARKGGAVKSFIITCLQDGKDYLVMFADQELTYEMFMVRLFSSGLTLDQVDEPDVNTLDDGSLGASDNPDQI